MFNRSATIGSLSIRIEAELLELLGPTWIGIAQALDVEATGKRASTAALTSCGVRNASESARLI
jgi:hypothetical protein